MSELKFWLAVEQKISLIISNKIRPEIYRKN